MARTRVKLAVACLSGPKIASHSPYGPLLPMSKHVLYTKGLQPRAGLRCPCQPCRNVPCVLQPTYLTHLGAIRAMFGLIGTAFAGLLACLPTVYACLSGLWVDRAAGLTGCPARPMLWTCPTVVYRLPLI